METLCGYGLGGSIPDSTFNLLLTCSKFAVSQVQVYCQLALANYTLTVSLFQANLYKIWLWTLTQHWHKTASPCCKEI